MKQIAVFTSLLVITLAVALACIGFWFVKTTILFILAIIL